MKQLLLICFAISCFYPSVNAKDMKQTCLSVQQILPEGIALTAPPKLVEMAGLPAFCQVSGKMDGYIGFESRLPLDKWNGKFMMAGCGGLCGEVVADKTGYSNSINFAVARGYAATAHDSGHSGKSSSREWIQENPIQLDYWAYQSIPVVAELSKQLVANFYGKQANKNYFAGCSNGGRMGFIAAQRYPDLFDGIAAGGSIVDWTLNSGLYGAFLMQHMHTEQGERRFSSDNVDLLRKEVIAQCDSLDGVSDQVVSNPQACQLDFSKISCSANNSAACFNDNQIEHVKALYAGVKDKAGKQLFTGVPYGSEQLWSIWWLGNGKQAGWGALASQSFQNMFYKQPLGHDVAIHSIDIVENVPALRHGDLARVGNAVNLDLSQIEKNKTKFFIYHGWADPLIPPGRTVEYYQQAYAQSQDKQAFTDNIRMFMVPGNGHCWEQKGLAPDLFDPLMVLENWVEKGQAPEQVVTYETEVGKGNNTRLLCPFPQQATYNGKGDVSSHKNYQCK